MVTMSTRARFVSQTAAVLALLGTVALGGCGGDATTGADPADAFVGAWHYDQSSGAITCPLSDPIDEAPIGNKIFGFGVSAPLVDLTASPVDHPTFCDTYFDISGAVATARTDASCTITGGDIVTIDSWTFSLTSATTAEEIAATTLHITVAAVPPATTPTTSNCAYRSMSLLTRVAKD